MKLRQNFLAVVTISLLAACSGGDSADSLPVVTVTNATVQEGDSETGELVFTVSLDVPANGFVNVNYATADGTATVVGNDYLPADGLLTIEPGFTSTAVSVSVLGDVIPENNETISLSLSNPTANVTLGQSIAAGTILNDELAQLSLPEIPRGIISTSGKRMPIHQDIINNSNITGFMVLDGWNDIESSEGVFDWAHIDSEVERARAAGKVVHLAIHAGGDSAPSWVFKSYPEVKKVIWYNKITGDTEWVPAYWDPVYIELKRRFYDEIGIRYNDEAGVVVISASMVDPNTGDWAFVASTDEQIQSYLDSGFTETHFINAYKKVLDYSMTAFQDKFVITSVGPVPDQLVSDRYFAVHQVLDYAYATYGRRLIIAKGSLNAATPAPADVSNIKAWYTILKYSPNVAGQLLWNVTSDPEFKMNGGSEYSESQAGDVFLDAVEIGRGYNLRWIEVWGIDILNSNLKDEINAAAQLLGS